MEPTVHIYYITHAKLAKLKNELGAIKISNHILDFLVLEKLFDLLNH